MILWDLVISEGLQGWLQLKEDIQDFIGFGSIGRGRGVLTQLTYLIR